MAALVNAEIQYESAQQQYSFAAMTAATGNKTFSLSTKPWSNAAGYEYKVSPYGVINGGVITPNATADKIDVSACLLSMAGATGANSTTGELTVALSTGTLTVTRGASTNICIINSLTVTSAGAWAVVAGTASTAFSETRGAAGGPPFIPVGSAEVGQIRLTSITSAAVLASEIYQSPGVHQERYDFPVYSVDAIRGQISFASALPAIHTGSVPKQVYARVATPVFAPLGRTKDWKPAEATSSVSSDNYYDGPVGSVSSSIGQASFTAVLADGVTDAILAIDGQERMFKFLPDKNKTAYQITQGIFRKARTYSVGANPTMSATISASAASVDFSS